MTNLVLTTFDWVPDTPRGYVRDIRVRWALEEAGLPYSVKSVPFRARGTEHFSNQPFGQVPWLTDGDISIFESGAILLHLGSLTQGEQSTYCGQFRPVATLRSFVSPFLQITLDYPRPARRA